MEQLVEMIAGEQHALFALRHGRTGFNEQDRLTTVTDVALSEHGELQAERVGRALVGQHFHRVLSSPKQRALNTAQRATAGCLLDTPLIADPRLIEPDAGPFEGLTFTELREGPMAASYAAYCATENPIVPAGAEPVEETAAKAAEILAEARAARGRTLVVGHGTFLRVLACVAIGADPLHYRRLKLDNCHALAVRFYPTPPAQLLGFNVRAF